MKDQMLTPVDAAKLLQVSPDTVRVWLRKGILQGTKVGGGKLWRISKVSIEKIIKQDPSAKM